MGQDRGETLILKVDRNVGKSLCKMLQEDVDILCSLRRSTVHIARITNDKAHDILIFGIFFKIIYYLCRMYRFKSGRKDTERIAHSDSDPFSTVIYAYNPIHRRAKLLIKKNLWHRRAEKRKTGPSVLPS